jgi:hypothetical protein
MANPLQQEEEEEEEEIWSTLHPTTMCIATNDVQQQKLKLQENPKP